MRMLWIVTMLRPWLTLEKEPAKLDGHVRAGGLQAPTGLPLYLRATRHLLEHYFLCEEAQKKLDYIMASGTSSMYPIHGVKFKCQNSNRPLFALGVFLRRKEVQLVRRPVEERGGNAPRRVLVYGKTEKWFTFRSLY
jgi:hypothetical protein